MPHTSQPNRRWLRWVTLPGLGLVVGFLVALLPNVNGPELYRSTVVMDASGSGPGQRLQVPEDPLGTALSDNTFDLVAKRLELHPHWDAAAAADLRTQLRTMVTGDYSSSTKELEIRVVHEEAQTSREVAGAFIHAYREERLKVERAKAERNLRELDESIREQEDLVEEKRKLFHTIVRAIGIPYIEGADQAAVTEEAVLRSAQVQQFEREKEKRGLEIQIKTLLKLKDEELFKYAAGLNLPDSGVAGLPEQFRAAEGMLAQLRAAGPGADDRRVIEAQKNLDALEVDLRESVVVLQEILQTQLQLVDGQLEKLQEVVETRRSDAVDNALQSRDYVEAKEDYEQAKAALVTMKLQGSQRKFAMRFALNGPSRLVRKLDLSEVSTERVEAKLGLRLVAGSVIGLLGGFGMAGLLAMAGKRSEKEAASGG